MSDQPPDPSNTSDNEGDLHPPEAMRLRSRRAPVTRLSRKVLYGLSAVVAIGISAALFLALQPRHPNSQTEVADYTKPAAPDGLASLPQNYAGLPRHVPRLGPPLPGDLGPPIVHAGAPAPGMGTTTGSGNAEATHFAQEQAAALKSRLFVTTDLGRPGANGDNVTAQTPNTEQRAKTGSGLPSTAGTSTSSSFPAGTLNQTTVSPERLVAEASPDILQAGSMIPAALLTGIRSDLPGTVTAQVTEDVYDSPTGTILLIPQGARLIGVYNSQIGFGQSRVQLVWTRLIMPDGKSILLDNEPAADPAGYSGLHDRVDNHWGQLFQAAILSTMLSVGSEAGVGNNANGIVQAIRQGASQSINQVGEQVVGRSLGIQPTLTIRPGFPVRVMVTRDLVLEPYRT